MVQSPVRVCVCVRWQHGTSDGLPHAILADGRWVSDWAGARQWAG